jgi:hypothetical protein
MVLLICPDCSGKVSDLAPACPHCGRPASKTRVDLPPTTQSVTGQAQQESERSEPAPNTPTFEVPSTWEEVGTRNDLIDQIKSAQIPGCCIGETWYFDPKPIMHYAKGKPISPAEDPEIIENVVRREILAFWGGRETYTGKEIMGWHLQSPYLVWLVCRHQALGQLKIIRYRRTSNFFAAFFPGLWHLVTWTKDGLGYFIAGMIATFVGTLQVMAAFQSSYGGMHEQAWYSFWAQGFVNVVIFFIYLRSANGFRLRSLRTRGFQVVKVLEARSKDDALAKFNASGL